MKKFNVACAALNQIPLDWDGNLQRIKSAIAQARSNQSSILVLPELAISGYGCEDAFFAEHVRKTSIEQLDQIIPETSGMILAIGFPIEFESHIYNAAALIVNQQLVGIYCKQFLANDGVHYEARWFNPWPIGCVSSIEINGKNIPIGDLIFNCGGVRIGFEICRDAWVTNRSGIRLAERNVDLIINPSASHFAFNKYERKKELVIEGSKAFGAVYLYADMLGNEAGKIIYEGCCLIADCGKLISANTRFSYEEISLLVSEIDLEQTRQYRKNNQLLAQGDTNINAGEVVQEFAFKEAKLKIDSTFDLICSLPNRKCEEFTRAVSLALFDYLRKSKMRGFVISLSGGADSAAVASLVYLMAKLAIAELGLAKFKQRLAYFTEIQAANSLEELMPQLLCCVYQKTSNSSQQTEIAATKLAQAISAEFHLLDVDSIVETYLDKVSSALNYKPNWENDDASLQNIQARVRGPGVWLIANIKSALLLTTSNRSEAAVGYTTMDGDTCGGIAPIGGIDKAFLLEWLTWLEKIGPAEIGPIPALSYVLALEPTAELRPLASKQKDEADLMPYPILDRIERLAIRDKLSPAEVYANLAEDLADIDLAQLKIWVERFFTLWGRNQWKRERLAPAFHLDDKSLDPKTWCRFPILSGGYAYELKKL